MTNRQRWVAGWICGGLALTLAVVAAVRHVCEVRWRQRVDREAQPIFELLETLPRAERLVMDGQFSLPADRQQMQRRRLELADPEDIRKVALSIQAANPKVNYVATRFEEQGLKPSAMLWCTMVWEVQGRTYSIGTVGGSLMRRGNSSASVGLDGFPFMEIPRDLVARGRGQLSPSAQSQPAATLVE